MEEVEKQIINTYMWCTRDNIKSKCEMGHKFNPCREKIHLQLVGVDSSCYEVLVHIPVEINVLGEMFR